METLNEDFKPITEYIEEGNIKEACRIFNMWFPAIDEPVKTVADIERWAEILDVDVNDIG